MFRPSFEEEIALAIPALNESKIETKNSAAQCEKLKYLYTTLVLQGLMSSQ